MENYRSKKLVDAVHEGMRICEELHIPIGCITEIEANPRLKSTWGRCKKLTHYTYRIEIKSRLLESDVPHEVLMNTVLHELIHTCKNCMDHGEVFKRYAARLNAKGWEISTYVSQADMRAVPEPEPNYRYKVTCEACGHVWKYKTRGKVVRCLQADPTSCTCGCGGKRFTVEAL